MTTKRTSRKTKIALGITGVLVAAVAATGYLFTRPEVDSVAQNAPVAAEMIQIENQVPLLDDAHLAAGITYNFDNDQFLLSTDQPHTLRQQNEAHVYVLNSNLQEMITDLTLQVDGNLEGITYIGGNTVVAASEGGTLVYLSTANDGELVEQKRVSVFENADAHKLGSLTYDSENGHLYTAEKEGIKSVYQLDADGNLLDSFELSMDDAFTASRPDAMTNEYTISGMTYADGYLYVFSEAYSTIFKVNVDTRQVEQVFGVDQLPETAGITTKGNQFYMVGDLESYLPAPEIHIANIPTSHTAAAE